MRIHRIATISFATTCGAAFLLAGGALRAEEGAVEAAITAGELADHVDYLAGDALEGRGTGSEGERLAARYLIEKFEAAGLEPGSAEGTFLQPFTVAGRASLAGEPEVALEVGPWSRGLKAGEDFSPFGFSASGEVDAPLVFAGYGVTDPERGYDDYAGLDVEGKAVLVLRHEPREKEGIGEHSTFVRKAKNAAERGAVALLVVTDPRHHAGDDSLLPFGSGGGGDAEGLVALHVRQSLVASLFELAGADLKAVQTAIDEDLAPRRVDLDARLRGRLEIERPTLHPKNVVAKLPGRDPELADEVLVIGAHYDHLGRGHAGSSLDPHGDGEIHNGADDNASGTAGLIELAQAFAEDRPRRTVYFVAFSGEEMGLLGSQHFVEHPPIDRERIVAMINLDMIGRLRDESLEVGGVGTSPGFDALVTGAAEAEGLRLSKNASGYGPSDHASFYGAGIPVLFFFTGLHEVYHRPGDDPDTVNHDGMRRVLRTAFTCAEALANADERPAYVEVPRDRRRRPKVRMGIRLGQAEGGQGVAVASVGDGTPAAGAGLAAGDVIVRLGASDVGSPQDLIGALFEYEPGDAVDVVVLRDGERHTLRIEFPAP